LILDVPVELPVTTPEEVTLATVVLELVHVPPVGVDVRFTVEPPVHALKFVSGVGGWLKVSVTAEVAAAPPPLLVHVTLLR